ncbi:MAG: serine/threonine-protein kinase, partial [Actinomycetota bacterium]|nr:serine/threonine-protein kinase [Actinomycetota bacterium]
MEPNGTDSLVIAGRYRLGGRLGRGGMAEVFDAFDERLARPVAVKLLRQAMTADPGMRARFDREARSAASLNHPNVVAVYDSGEDAGRAFLVMERLPGETLADRMRSGPVDPEWLRGIALDVLSALDAAHRRRIVHRDIKPGNILIAADGRAKVADFGIAKAIRDGGDARGAEPATADLTTVGMLVGTIAYLSPEQIRGEQASPQSDLYALGVVLYEALGGRKPYPAGEPVAQARAVVEGAAPDIAELRPDVPPGLAAVVRRAMSRAPGDRFASASSMRDALLGERHSDTQVLPAALAPGSDATPGGAGLGAAPLAAPLAPPTPTALDAPVAAPPLVAPSPPVAPDALDRPDALDATTVACARSAPGGGGRAGAPPPPGGGGRRRRRGRLRRVFVGSLALLAVAAMLTAVALAGHERTNRRAIAEPKGTSTTTTPATTTTIPPGVSALFAEAQALDSLGGPGPTGLASLLEEVATTPEAQRAAQATTNAGLAEQLL